MISVLVGLQWMTVKGRAVRSMRLLRQPKYLVGFVVGACWMALSIGRPLLSSKVSIATPPGFEPSTTFAPLMHRLVVLFVTILLPLSWLFPWGAVGLSFREAELTMLLQAPVTRRQLIQYGLLKSELGVIFGALLMSLLFVRQGPFAWLLGFAATWLLFEFWHLNGRWRALFNLRQSEISVGAARSRRTALTVGLLAFYLALGVALSPLSAKMADALNAGGPERIFRSLADLEWPPLLNALTAPARWLTAPLFAEGVTAFLAAAVPVILGLIAQREIVLRSKARFEEKALEHAQKLETRKSPARRFARVSGRSRERRPFDLDRPGDPAVAVVWKNMMRVSRVPWTWVAVGGVALLSAICVLPATSEFSVVFYSVTSVMGIIAGILLPVGAGMMWNNDLRTELQHLELVRTWPVSPRRFVLAQVISPALLSFACSVFAVGLILAGHFGARLGQVFTGEPTQVVLLPRAESFLGVNTNVATVVLALSVLPMTAAIAFLSSSLQNLATIFLPAWMAHSAIRSRGIAAFGQRMVSFSALCLSLALALIPSGILVGAAVFGQWMIGLPWSAWEFPLWGTLAAIPPLVIGWWIVVGAAHLWERLDASEEVLEIGR